MSKVLYALGNNQESGSLTRFWSRYNVVKVMEKQGWRHMNLLLEALYWNVLFRLWAGSCTDSVLAVGKGVITEELWRRGRGGWEALDDVSICYSCHNKAPQNGWLKQQKFTFSQFWKPEVQDQGASEDVFQACVFGSSLWVFIWHVMTRTLPPLPHS